MCELEIALTPAMNKPKAVPSSIFPHTIHWVGSGCHREPGASLLDIPSYTTAKMTRRVEKIPRIEAYDR